jgi:hypothetical protein
LLAGQAARLSCSNNAGRRRGFSLGRSVHRSGRCGSDGHDGGRFRVRFCLRAQWHWCDGGRCRSLWRRHERNGRGG